MSYAEALAGSIITLDLNADGTLRAANAERRYTATLGGKPLPDRLERIVVTAEMLAGLIADEAALLLRVQECEAEAASLTTARDTALADKAAAETAHVATLATRDARIAELEAQVALLTAPPAPTTPITPLQARRALRAAGLYDAVKAAIDAAGPDVQDAWEFAIAWTRDDPLILSLGASLGLTGEQIDDLFALARTL